MRPCSIWVGFDPREASAFAVARESIKRHLNAPIPVRGLVLNYLQENGLYTRPTERRLGRIYDVLSKREFDNYDGACSTEFALSRFLVPQLAGHGLALFMDCDMLVRTNLMDVFRYCEDYKNRGKAVYCVKHNHNPENVVKMDGQAQTRYERKNWSSFMVFDVDHPANRALTLDYVNTAPGRDLHAFRWLEDDDIGELPPEWNHLVGHTEVADPKVVHFTDGGPWFEGFKNVPYAEEWTWALERWAA